MNELWKTLTGAQFEAMQRVVEDRSPSTTPPPHNLGANLKLAVAVADWRRERGEQEERRRESPKEGTPIPGYQQTLMEGRVHVLETQVKNLSTVVADLGKRLTEVEVRLERGGGKTPRKVQKPRVKKKASSKK